MSLTIKTFISSEIRGNAGPSEHLVQRSNATAVAFIDASFGSLGSDRAVVDQGLSAGDEVDRSITFNAAGGGIALEVTTSGSSQFSIHDGTGWVGPFTVVGGVPHAMLMKTADAAPVIRVKLKAIHSCSTALVRVYGADSPAQVAALDTF